MITVSGRRFCLIKSITKSILDFHAAGGRPATYLSKYFRRTFSRVGTKTAAWMLTCQPKHGEGGTFDIGTPFGNIATRYRALPYECSRTVK
jgi:hypothetical protein